LLLHFANREEKRRGERKGEDKWPLVSVGAIGADADHFKQQPAAIPLRSNVIIYRDIRRKNDGKNDE
jgi:hypothetical protein